jgi:hypothetical protein
VQLDLSRMTAQKLNPPLISGAVAHRLRQTQGITAHRCSKRQALLDF